MKSQTRSARVTVKWRGDAPDLLDRVDEKTRQTFERQELSCEAKLPEELRPRWRRISRLMLGLAPALPRAIGSNTMIFYIPDGQYRKQVFALHARKDGTAVIAMPDVLEDAVKSGLLRKPTRLDPPDRFGITANEGLSIAAVDGKSPSQEPFYKDMTGWNRRAMCISLAPDASPRQWETAESLCAMAAAEWYEQTAASA